MKTGFNNNQSSKKYYRIFSNLFIGIIILEQAVMKDSFEFCRPWKYYQIFPNFLNEIKWNEQWVNFNKESTSNEALILTRFCIKSETNETSYHFYPLNTFPSHSKLSSAIIKKRWIPTCSPNSNEMVGQSVESQAQFGLIRRDENSEFSQNRKTWLQNAFARLQNKMCGTAEFPALSVLLLLKL